MGVRMKGRGGPRPGSGRPKGTGKPTAQIRRNRVVCMVTDSELATLHRLADERGLPLGTVAYEILARGMRRK